MSYLKIIALIFLLCPVSSFADWDSSDHVLLSHIYDDVNHIHMDVDSITSYMFHHFPLSEPSLSQVIEYMQNDISVIRNSQLPSILVNVDASESHLKYMRDNFPAKLDNLKLIATALAGQNSEFATINLGFDSIGKNVQIISDSSASISNDVHNIHDDLSSLIFTDDDDISYLRVSPIPVSMDFSILTNHVLGAAYLNPEYGWGDYYELFDRYNDEDIDPEIFIAEMGLHNWYIGLLFGDWFVSTPDGWDEEDDYENRWGLVDEAQQFWSPMVESSAFQPYEMSNAKYFLYGTRQITDRFNDFMNFVETNAVSQAEDSGLGDPTTIEELEKVPEDIIPTDKDNQSGPVDEILATDVENDQFTTEIEDFLGSFEDLMTTGEAADTIEITFNASLLGGDTEVTISIKELETAKAKIDHVADWTLNGWKIAVMLFITSCCAKTLMSSKGELVGLHE